MFAVKNDVRRNFLWNLYYLQEIFEDILSYGLVKMDTHRCR
jgi:hypothetical protein